MLKGKSFCWRQREKKSKWKTIVEKEMVRVKTNGETNGKSVKGEKKPIVKSMSRNSNLSKNQWLKKG